MMSDGSVGPVGPEVDKKMELTELVAILWQRVIGQVNKLTEAHDSFGFVHFNANLNPSLPDILKAFGFVDFVLVTLMESGNLEPEEMRKAINSRQCILKAKSLHLALAAHDQDEYERIMTELKNQAQF